jgi:hypothetical protein
MEKCTSGTQSAGRRSSRKLFFTLPTAALTFQALNSPSGKDRSGSIGSWDGTPGSQEIVYTRKHR